jgi:hypothetical protein
VQRATRSSGVVSFASQCARDFSFPVRRCGREWQRELAGGLCYLLSLRHDGIATTAHPNADWGTLKMSEVQIQALNERLTQAGEETSTHFHRSVIRAGTEFESRMSHLFA